MPARPRRYWLVKSEPELYALGDLERDRRTAWEGVRNYQARNSMKDDMAPGDLVLFYHSNAEPTGVVGLAKVASAAHADETQFDPESDYYERGATRADPRWMCVDLAFVERFAKVVTLAELKADPELDGMLVTRRGMRLSVQPVELGHFRRVLALARARTKLPK